MSIARSDDDLRVARAALTMIRPAPFNAEAPPEALQGDTTATAHHYVRSNFALPEHDGSLVVGGSVANALTLTLAELRAMPPLERVVTLECAGNGRLRQMPLPVGEPWCDLAVSAATWKGARLADVLRRAHPLEEGVDVVFTGADHGPYEHFEDLTFARSLTVAQATDPAAEILIAYEMNGEPLTLDHGAPFRLIVPSWYGMASVKWLRSIDVSTSPFIGEFQTSHYMYEWPDGRHEPVTVMRVRSHITDPSTGATLASGTYTVRGKAWSGHGPITDVRVSVSGGDEWSQARVAAAKGPHQWQDWTYEWNVADAGRHSIRARATDAAGNTQPDVPQWNRLGYGNNAVEVRYIDVR